MRTDELLYGTALVDCVQGIIGAAYLKAVQTQDLTPMREAVLKLRGISLFLGFTRRGARNGADTAIALSNEIGKVEQFIWGVECKGWPEGLTTVANESCDHGPLEACPREVARESLKRGAR